MASQPLVAEGQLSAASLPGSAASLSGSWCREEDGRFIASIGADWIQFSDEAKLPLQYSQVGDISWSDVEGKKESARLESDGRLATSRGHWIRYAQGPEKTAGPSADKPPAVPVVWAISLAVFLVSLMSFEVILLLQSQVPWLLDKSYMVVALVFQLAMAMFPVLQSVGASKTCTSTMMDVCHWVFVVMAFAGPIVLRAFSSLLLVALLTFGTLVFRLGLSNTCIITSLAEVTSLPNISNLRVTVLFGLLMLFVSVRLLLVAFYGQGFPIDQLMEWIFNGH